MPRTKKSNKKKGGNPLRTTGERVNNPMYGEKTPKNNNNNKSPKTPKHPMKECLTNKNTGEKFGFGCNNK